MTTTTQAPDIELGTLRDGYPALAKWIAQDPDDDPLVFRRFGRQSARSLLHLQCRLVALVAELDALDEEARSAKDVETRRSLQRWETLIANAKTDESVEDRLVKKQDEFETLLEKYYRMLTLRSQIAHLNKPSDRVIAAYQDYLQGTAFGDYLSRFLQDHWPFQKRSDPLDRTTIYKNLHVVRTVSALSLTLAATLLICAIVNLYLTSSSEAKLGFIAMYTLLFSTSMEVCTKARRAEVFVASAAYAAVLVVFVSGDLGREKSVQ
ncbi:hypothetical protein K458DRAFT_439699 [Lentithecium fluviatile CBS 122367]|uniref:DUF6594 domain-containing protein n=1 Tax=Lentithecium fluviatile CBS 122367 TaxID=1168545 RepID=A0A6G1JFY5_9PLEO|nr:hypothetical protein K458DRAFT_439699 [Lentithecium fluviatile CBS 122367]